MKEPLVPMDMLSETASHITEYIIRNFTNAPLEYENNDGVMVYHKIAQGVYNNVLDLMDNNLNVELQVTATADKLTDGEIINALLYHNYQLSDDLEKYAPEYYYKSDLIAEVNDFWRDNIDGTTYADEFETKKAKESRS